MNVTPADDLETLAFRLRGRLAIDGSGQADCPRPYSAGLRPKCDGTERVPERSQETNAAFGRQRINCRLRLEAVQRISSPTIGVRFSCCPQPEPTINGHLHQVGGG